MRGIFGTVFPLFSVQLYNGIGLHRAGTRELLPILRPRMLISVSLGIAESHLRTYAFPLYAIRSLPPPSIEVRTVIASTSTFDWSGGCSWRHYYET